MIEDIIKRWENNKANLRQHIIEDEESYKCKDCEDLLRDIIKIVLNDDMAEFHETNYSHDKITVIDDGHYQGTLIFVFPEDAYQPDETEYIYTSVSYGSCSVCDTLGAAQMGDHLVDDMMTLALHLVQNMKYLKGAE